MSRPVRVTFLWMHRGWPLAVALVIASVCVPSTMIGAAQITQLRRVSRQRY